MNNKKVLVLSTSPRAGGNSDQLADAFVQGAQSMNCEVEKIQIKNKNIHPCTGCLICHKTTRCFMEDDAVEINEKMKYADVIVFATPVYYYGMCGQMKTMLDRTNPLYNDDYQFKDIYLLATAADDEEDTFDGTIMGLKGWIRCYEHATFKGKVCIGGVTQVGDIQELSLKEAFEMGKNI